MPLAGATSMRHVGADDMGLGDAVSVHQVAGGVQVVRRLQRDDLDSGERALGESGECSGGWNFEECGDAEFAHGLHAEVPAHRVADLHDQPLEVLAAALDHGAVGVGEQTSAGVVGRDGACVVGEHLDGGLHVCGVERTGHRERAKRAHLRAGRRETP